jgi:hypothetical protein
MSECRAVSQLKIATLAFVMFRGPLGELRGGEIAPKHLYRGAGWRFIQ